MSFSFPAGFARRMERLLAEDWPRVAAAYEEPLRRGLRVNGLKCTPAQLLAQFPLPLIPSPFAAGSFFVQGEWKAGTDPLHHAGAYYMQEPSATSAVTALAPQPGEAVLDLCAAPGGKSTQIAAALRGEGVLWCNEFVRERARALMQNLERCGVRNAVVTSSDTASLCAGLTERFDAVLVDAPCSGEGMFRKEPAALAQWSEELIRQCAARQTRILDDAAQAVRPGGRLLYSTCTFAPEENELAVCRFLASHPDFCLEDLSALPFGRPGFVWEQVVPFAAGEIQPDVPLTRCRRLLPGDGGEGHFLALFRREGNSPSLPFTAPEKERKKSPFCNSFNDLYFQCFSGSPYGVPSAEGTWIRLLPEKISPSFLKVRGVISAGVTAAEIRRDRLEPVSGLFLAAQPGECLRRVNFAREDPLLSAFLRGEEIPVESPSGYTAVLAGGVTVGFGKCSGGRLKNRYPKGLRLLSR